MDTFPKSQKREALESVVIRFAGDSGDGMQLAGTQLTNTSALAGNDVATFPDFPAEIRAPAGTIPGVSAFQVHFGSQTVLTPGDEPDALVAMNPAALAANLHDLKTNGVIIANVDEFNPRSFRRAGIESNALEDGSLAPYRLFQVQLTTLTRRALEDSGLDVKTQDRCKNFFALGLIYWMFSRPLENTVGWLQEKFRNRPGIADANEKVLRAGFNVCDITEVFQTR